jgi:putative ABC transport system substrate-binding protein
MRRLQWMALALHLALANTSVWAQQSNRIPVVGVLMAISAPDDPIVDALRQGLRELGYVEGRTVKIEFRTALGHADRLPGLAEELVKQNVDVIFAAATPAIEAVRRATSTIPIVMALGGDPVAAGLVASLAKPGGNVTGLSSMSAELNAKVLQLLKETVPRLSRVAVLWNPDSPLSPVQRKLTEDLKSAAPSLSIELVFVQIGKPEEVEAAFATANRARVQAIFVTDGPLIYSQRAVIAQLAAKARLPAIYRTRVFAEAGGLMSYGASWLDQTRQAAGYIDKILKGAKPRDLPMEQPTKFELVVNLKTAKALGITVPQSILLRADEVIR